MITSLCRADHLRVYVKTLNIHLFRICLFLRVLVIVEMDGSHCGELVTTIIRMARGMNDCAREAKTTEKGPIKILDSSARWHSRSADRLVWQKKD